RRAPAQGARPSSLGAAPSPNAVFYRVGSNEVRERGVDVTRVVAATHVEAAPEEVDVLSVSLEHPDRAIAVEEFVPRRAALAGRRVDDLGLDHPAVDVGRAAHAAEVVVVGGRSGTTIGIT